MKIKKNGKVINLTESNLEKIIKGKKDSINFKKEGEVVEINETELKQIVNRYKINKFLNEQTSVTDINNDGVVDERDFVKIVMDNFEKLFKSEYIGTGGVPIKKADFHNLMAPIKAAMYKADDTIKDLIKKAIADAEKNKEK